ncbi:MAG: HAD-IA family hydrolase [Nitrosopumilus sp.]|nr:MAG: HAD-IA family hydrolase [Nitrosopumilus sp.]
MAIQVILFDIGGVFFTWKDRWLFNNIANKFGLSEQHLANECKKELPDLRLGKISEQEMWQKIGRQINSKELSNAKDSLIHNFFKSKISIDGSVFTVIKQLKKKNIKTGILSNTSLVMHSAVEKLINMRHFDYLFLSYEIEMEKPDKAIFEHVIKEIPCPKEEILFIDDRLSNVNAAKNFGIKAIRFTDTVHLIADLNDLEIL